MSILIAIILIASGLSGYFIGRKTNPSHYGGNEIPKQPEVSQSEAAGVGDEDTSFDLTLRTESPPLDDKESFVQWMKTNVGGSSFFLEWRWDCVQDLLSWNSIRNDRVLEAFLRTPREDFIREENRPFAYDHRYMPIGYGATITDPWVVSIMTQVIDPGPEHRVLEIGTGSGYQAAILAQMTHHVYSIEIIEELARETDELYSRMETDYPEYSNISRMTGDGYYGLPEQQPFDRIIVTCSIDHVPPFLLRQMAPGGIMVIPIGPPSGQTLMKIMKNEVAEGVMTYERVKIMPVKFVPFTMEGGGSYSAEEERSDSGSS